MTAATFGFATSASALTLYTTSIIVPHMIADLGWTKAEFAALGTLSLVIALFFPLAGRIADVFGVRRAALIGIVVLPLTCLAYSAMTGPIWQYVLIYLVGGILSITTGNMIYSRLAVQYIDRARGLALAIVASGPPVTGAILSFLINPLVEAEGWRTTYYVLAAYTAVAGVITLSLLPRDRPVAIAAAAPKRRAREDYPLIFRTPAFWILLVSMLLCNLPTYAGMSQLKLILMENGILAEDTSVMLAAFPMGVMLGRFVAGLALDRFPAHLVGFIGAGLPSIGLFLLTTSLDAPSVLTFSVLCVGFSIGAEGDILAFVVARRFGVAIYSSVMGLMTMIISLSVSLGAALLSLTLKLTGTFDLFMLICAIAVFAGSLLFLFIGNQRAPEAAPQAA